MESVQAYFLPPAGRGRLLITTQPDGAQWPASQAAGGRVARRPQPNPTAAFLVRPDRRPRSAGRRSGWPTSWAGCPARAGAGRRVHAGNRGRPSRRPWTCSGTGVGRAMLAPSAGRPPATETVATTWAMAFGSVGQAIDQRRRIAPAAGVFARPARQSRCEPAAGSGPWVSPGTSGPRWRPVLAAAARGSAGGQRRRPVAVR